MPITKICFDIGDARMKNKFLQLGLLLLIPIIGNAFGQNVQLLYTKAVTQEALAYKTTLKAENLSNFNALALRNISDQRKNAYLSEIANIDAIIIIGETGLKSVNLIDFPMPVIIINGAGETLAKGPVFRIFRSDFEEIGNVANIVKVTDANVVQIPDSNLTNKTTMAFKCDGISDEVIINKILDRLKK
jgi:hypothetical protein